ncbi:MAG: serine/threonine-protein kinase [Nannocystaceae bacterium]
MRTGDEAGTRPTPARRPNPDEDSLATIVESPPSIHPGFAGPTPSLDPREIGRFRVLRRLGEGGMGVVYSAFDEELDRRVAIKLLRRGPSREREAIALRREAQAMARVSHPNVVQVYEVGDFEGQIFIAMEFIHGQTLREWLRDPHPLSERLAMLAQAGAGLAAAHAAGVVHRDFKPDNVLVGDDGRARVVDFGLATQVEGEPTGSRSITAEREVTQSASVSAPSFAGTPPYMSPEQHLREAPGPASDVFSFAVTLHEAVYGLRPFRGPSTRELREQVLEGRVEAAPREAAAPPWLRRAILRGLSLLPEDRGRMDAFVATLSRDPGRGRRRTLAALGAGLVVAVAGVALVRDGAMARARCRSAAAQLQGIWDGNRRRAVEEALLATEVPYAAATSRAVAAELDRYGDAWVAMHNDACAATMLRGEQSAELLDLRMACLHRHLGAFSAQIDVLARADEAAVEAALAAVQQLPPLTECADATALRSAAARREDPARARQAAPLRERLDRASAERNAAHHSIALEMATKVEQDARALGLWDVVVAAEIIAAEAAAQLADYAGAEASLEAAFTAALAQGDDPGAAEAAIELIFVVGYYQGEHEEGARWGRIAAALLDRLGDDGPLRARYNNNVGVLLHELGDLEGAIRHHEAGLEIYERTQLDVLRLTALLNNLGVAYQETGRLADARATFERALARLTEAYGEDHPNVAATIENLGTVYFEEGDRDAAAANYRAALTIRRRVLPDGHPRIAISMINLASVELERGSVDVAMGLARGALTILREALGERHKSVAFARSVLADALLAAEELEAARAEVDAALELYRGDPAGNPSILALPLVVLAEIDERSGELDAAEREIAEVVELAGRDPTTSKADVGRIRFVAARIRWLRGDLEAAARDLDAAEAAYTDAGPSYGRQRRALAAWREGHAMIPDVDPG